MKAKAAQCREAAFTLIELLVVVAIVVMIATVLLPHPHTGTRQKATQIVCMSNLRQVGVGFVMWATDHEDRLPWQVSTNAGGAMELTSNGQAVDHFLPLLQLLTTSNYFQPRTLHCPTDKTRTATENRVGFSRTNLSYFTALGTITNGPEIVLSGDRHLQLNGKPAPPGVLLATNSAALNWSRELHPRTSGASGNLLFADGHVELIKTEKLPAVFQRQAVLTNLLVLP